eukprot:365255-Chlamydomonas_euryale.AAC.36
MAVHQHVTAFSMCAILHVPVAHLPCVGEGSGCGRARGITHSGEPGHEAAPPHVPRTWPCQPVHVVALPH